MQWTWTWANFGKWRGAGRPGVLPSMGSQTIGRDWATEQQKRWIWFPVLYGRTLLLVYFIYNSLHLLIPSSHSIPPPSLNPLATTTLFSVSMRDRRVLRDLFVHMWFVNGMTLRDWIANPFSSRCPIWSMLVASWANVHINACQVARKF